MIAHVVLFRPSPSLDAAQQEALVAALEKALVGIPGIARAMVGRRRMLGRFYDAQASAQFDYAAVLEFASSADLLAYLEHPAHLELGRRFFESAEATLVHDFEMVDASRVRELLGGR